MTSSSQDPKADNGVREANNWGNANSAKKLQYSRSNYENIYRRDMLALNIHKKQIARSIVADTHRDGFRASVADARLREGHIRRLEALHTDGYYSRRQQRLLARRRGQVDTTLQTYQWPNYRDHVLHARLNYHVDSDNVIRPTSDLEIRVDSNARTSSARRSAARRPVSDPLRNGRLTRLPDIAMFQQQNRLPGTNRPYLFNQYWIDQSKLTRETNILSLDDTIHENTVTEEPDQTNDPNDVSDDVLEISPFPDIEVQAVSAVLHPKDSENQEIQPPRKTANKKGAQTNGKSNRTETTKLCHVKAKLPPVQHKPASHKQMRRFRPLFGQRSPSLDQPFVPNFHFRYSEFVQDNNERQIPSETESAYARKNSTGMTLLPGANPSPEKSARALVHASGKYIPVKGVKISGQRKLEDSGTSENDFTTRKQPDPEVGKTGKPVASIPTRRTSEDIHITGTPCTSTVAPSTDAVTTSRGTETSDSSSSTSDRKERQQQQKVEVSAVPAAECLTNRKTSPTTESKDQEADTNAVRSVLKRTKISKAERKRLTVQFGPEYVRMVTKITYPWNEAGNEENDDDDDDDDDNNYDDTSEEKESSEQSDSSTRDSSCGDTVETS